MPNLVKLGHLSELWLYIGRHQLPLDTKVLYELPQLRSIKLVYLEISSLTEQQFFYWIPPLLPNLEQLTLKCDYEFGGGQNGDDENAMLDQKMDRFKARIRQQFRHLQQLQA